MSDFWEKNKGSITSGLKTAGKYGYQGTKYVAKTGYKASKNANSRRKERERRKNKEGEDEEEEEEEDHKRHSRYDQQPPYGQNAVPYGYVPPQQQWQPPYPQQQPFYPSYPQQYPQAPQQYQPPMQQYNQIPPMSQIPQGYQQPYQAPQAYPHTPESQQAYQIGQPQPLQQPQLGYPTQAPGQVPGQAPGQVPSQAPGQVPSQAPGQIPTQPTSQVPTQIPTGAVPLPPRGGNQINPAAQQIQGPGAVQPVVGSFQSQSIQSSASGPIPLPGGYSQGQLFNQGSETNPQMAAQSSQPSLSIKSDVSSKTGSPIPSVVPYQREQAEERRLAERIPIPQVDLSNLPPPPTHRDRGSTEGNGTTGSASPSPSNIVRPISRNATNACSETRLSEPVEHPIPLLNDAEHSVQSIASETSLEQLPSNSEPLVEPSLPNAVPKSNVSTSVLNEEAVEKPKATQSRESNEKPTSGITGRFNYDIQVNYAPPPKPHRGMGSSSSIDTSAKSRGNYQSRNSSSSSGPPPLPNRVSAASLTSSASFGETPPTNFLPPPKPFKYTQSDKDDATKQVSPPSRDTEVPAEVSLANKEVTDFPPLPIPKRLNVSAETNRQSNSILPVNDHFNQTPHGRGRLHSVETEHPPSSVGDSLEETSSGEPGHKKASPPVVKPKPKNLTATIASSNSKSLPNETTILSGSGGLGDISNELAHLKLRKTGTNLVNSARSNESVLTTEVKRPPKVPPKKDVLRKSPPVPIKSSALQATPNNRPQAEEDSNDNNPFSIYLKSAVPSEYDRLHRE